VTHQHGQIGSGRITDIAGASIQVYDLGRRGWQTFTARLVHDAGPHLTAMTRGIGPHVRIPRIRPFSRNGHYA
jgi:hypothetical protein